MCLTQHLIQQQFSFSTKNNHMKRAKTHCHRLEQASWDLKGST